GLGNARTLTQQFVLRDFTVVKVMFSAIVTATLGLFWLARAGVVDPAFLYVPDTSLLSQSAGGLIFGAGLAFAGLCPGTACVSAASGRADGVAVAGGLFTGVLVTGLLFPGIERIYEYGPSGMWTLPQLTGLPQGTVVFALVVMALTLFGGAEFLCTPRTPRTPRIPRIPWLALL